MLINSRIEALKLRAIRFHFFYLPTELFGSWKIFKNQLMKLRLNLFLVLIEVELFNQWLNVNVKVFHTFFRRFTHLIFLRNFFMKMMSYSFSFKFDLCQFLSGFITFSSLFIRFYQEYLIEVLFYFFITLYFSL